ncbi:MAG: T9SS type A sorting domain-containing protein [Fluviicola sp.]|nr:T9SS type A sorting domain-containing protein [Fluviicola sp.]
MKIISAFLISLLVTPVVSAQNFEITHELDQIDVSATIIYYSNLSPNTNLTTYFSLINHSGSTQEISVQRLKMDVPASWIDNVSLEPIPDPTFQQACYPPSELNPWTTPASCTIQNNEVAKMTVTYNLSQESGDGVYRYYFMNGPVILDSVDVSLSMVLSTTELTTETIFMYPNPAKTHVYFSGASIQKAQVFDLNGKCVIDVEKVTNNEIAIASLTDGMYQIVLETDQGIQTQNLVVHK